MNYSRLILIPLVVIALTGCYRSRHFGMKSTADHTDTRIQQLLNVRDYAAAETLLDSMMRTGSLTDAVVAGERGCIALSQSDYREAERLLGKALADEKLRWQAHQCYLSFSRAMASCMIGQHKWEDALRLSKRVCNETRFSNALDDQLYAIQMYADIGSCQIRLHNDGEAKTVADNVYNSSRDFLQRDSSTAINMFFATLTIMEAYHYVDNWAETNLWVDRSLEAMQRVEAFHTHPGELDMWTGYLQCIKSIALEGLGRHREAAEAYRAFEATAYSKGLGRQNALYYLTATNQWERVEQMLPERDSLLNSLGAEMIPEHLADRYGYPYQTYRHLGRKDQALAVADSMFAQIGPAIVRERHSKALDLAALYETQEKEQALKEKDMQLGVMWTATVAAVFLALIIGLIAVIIVRRKAENRLKEEHQKLVDAYDQLLVANAKAEESMKMKTSFIQQVSHEIRTPLNILSGFTQILTTPGVDIDEQTKAEASKTIVDNTARITKLVNKMLELSDISTKAVIERSDSVPAGLIAEQAIADIGVAQQPGIHFTYNATEQAQQTILQTHQRSAIRALVLLLGNAKKFLAKPQQEPVGDVTLTLDVDRRAKTARFVVEDTGIGVPPAEAERIFEEFVQLNDYYDGTGIGLTVARNLARRIGGDVRLDTTYQPGARFVLTLPL